MRRHLLTSLTRRFRLAAVCATVGWTVLATPVAADCQPAPPLDEALGVAPAAFVGTVIGVDGPSARFAVSEVWAGEIGPTVEVRGLADLGGRDGGFGPGFSEDDRRWTDGATYLVLPSVDGGVLRDHLCTATTEWREELAALRPETAIVVSAESAEGGGGLPLPILALVAAAVAIAVIGGMAFSRR
jgi:hypothetical protein